MKALSLFRLLSMILLMREEGRRKVEELREEAKKRGRNPPLLILLAPVAAVVLIASSAVAQAENMTCERLTIDKLDAPNIMVSTEGRAYLLSGVAVDGLTPDQNRTVVKVFSDWGHGKNATASIYDRADGVLEAEVLTDDDFILGELINCWIEKAFFHEEGET